jgi:ketosteroid isomerase-like protein
LAFGTGNKTVGMEPDLLTNVRSLFAAIERGDRAALLAHYAENAVQIEHPNRLKPKGDRRAPEKMAEDLARGKQILRSELYEIANAVVSGDRVALQVEWTGVLAIAVGGLKAGDTMRSYSGIFLRFRDGLIVEQHNYDCFEDFLTPKA